MSQTARKLHISPCLPSLSGKKRRYVPQSGKREPEKKEKPRVGTLVKCEELILVAAKMGSPERWDISPRMGYWGGTKGPPGGG